MRAWCSSEVPRLLDVLDKVTFHPCASVSPDSQLSHPDFLCIGALPDRGSQHDPSLGGPPKPSESSSYPSPLLHHFLSFFSVSLFSLFFLLPLSLSPLFLWLHLLMCFLCSSSSPSSLLNPHALFSVCLFKCLSVSVSLWLCLSVPLSYPCFLSLTHSLSLPLHPITLFPVPPCISASLSISPQLPPTCIRSLHPASPRKAPQAHSSQKEPGLCRELQRSLMRLR